MAKVKVITDTGSDLPNEICTSLNISTVPLKIRFGEKEYLDKFELTNEKFWELCLKGGDLPQTAAPSAGQFQAAYGEAKAQGFESVICITLSSELSATYQSALIAAKEVQGEIDVTVIDSRCATIGEGSLVIHAAQLAQADVPYPQIVSEINDKVSKVKLFGTLDTLDFLKRGGRIGAAAALLGSLLSFKPLIEIRSGLVEPDGRQRTRAKALAYLRDRVSSFSPISHVGVAHANAPDIDDFIEKLSEQTHVPIDEITVTSIGPVIGTHAGPRTLGVTFWVD